MMTINFNATPSECHIIKQIAQRYKTLRESLGWQTDLLDVVMDITATHMNGCPLDLQKLLSAQEMDFAHDVAGIREHLDRKTGRLENCFLPRYAK